MWGNLPKPSPLKSLFFENATQKRTGALSAIEIINQAA
jgi:hypothetical protein